MFMLAVGYGYLLYTPFLEKWIYTPVYMAVDSSNFDVAQIPFPAITICSNNKIVDRQLESVLLTQPWKGLAKKDPNFSYNFKQALTAIVILPGALPPAGPCACSALRGALPPASPRHRWARARAAGHCHQRCPATGASAAQPRRPTWSRPIAMSCRTGAAAGPRTWAQQFLAADAEGVAEDSEWLKILRRRLKIPNSWLQIPRGWLKIPRGVAQDSEGAPQDSEGVAQDSEGVAQDSEGVAHDSEGMTQESEGVA